MMPFKNISKTKNQMISNTLTGWLAMTCRMAIALVMVPFLLKYLGKDGYGMIGLISVIVSFSTIADFGLRQALGRELSEKVANHDIKGFRRLSSTALALYLSIAVVLICAGWFLAPWLVTFFKVTSSLHDAAVRLIRIYGSASLLVSFITPVFTAGLQSFLRFDAVNMIQAISGIASGALMFVFMTVIPLSPLIIWAAVMSLIMLADLFIYLIMYRRWCYSGQLGLKYLYWSEIKPLLHLGGYMYVLQLTNALAERSDPLIISYFFGTAGIALYQSGAKVSQMLRPLILIFSSQIHPLTTQFHVHNELDKQRKTLVLGTRYTLLSGAVASAGIILFAEPFCRLWLFDVLRGDYMTAVNVMRLWALVDFSDYAAAMHWPTLLGKKKMRFSLSVMVPSATINILVSIFLVGYTDWGIPGVLLATIITGLVRRPVVIWYICKITGLSMKEYIRSAYVPPGIMFIILLAFIYVLRMASIHSWAALIWSAGLYCGYASLILLIIEWRLAQDIWRKWRIK